MRLLLLLLFLAATLFSQLQQKHGVLKDESRMPLAGKTVSLIKATDSSTIKLAVAKANASAIHSKIIKGNYKYKVPTTFINLSVPVLLAFILVHLI